MTDAPAAAADGKPGPADLIEIFYAPSSVFARRRGGEWGLPYIGLAVLGVGLYFATKNLLQPVMDAETSRNMAVTAAKNHLTADQVAAGTSFGHTIAVVFLVAFFVVAPFIIAALLWLVGLFTKVREMGSIAIMIAVFSLFPRLVGTVVSGIEAAVLPDSAMTSVAAISISPARFVDPATSPGLAALLGRFDLFVIWGIVLMVIGLRVAGRATKGQAWTTAIVMWVLGSIPAFLTILRS